MNPLCFRVPLVSGRSLPGKGHALLACFNPESIMPLTQGIYLEDGEPKHDSLLDWDRFWRPLRRFLWPQDAEQPDDDMGGENDYGAEFESVPLAGISYKDSIDSLVRRLSTQEKRDMQDNSPINVLQFPKTLRIEKSSAAIGSGVATHMQGEEVFALCSESLLALQELRHGIEHVLFDTLDRRGLNTRTLANLIEISPGVSRALTRRDTERIATEKLIEILENIQLHT
jgi:hypothetical protein